MYFDYSCQRKLSIGEPDDHLEAVEAQVFCRPESSENTDVWREVLAGQFAGTRLDLDRVETYGDSVYDVFDARSSELESLYAQLFDCSSDEISDAVTDNVVDEIVYLEHSIIHPALREWRCFLMDHFCNLFGCFAVIAIWDTTSHSTVDLSDDDLERLGFAKVPGTQLLARSNAVRTSYNAHIEPRDAYDAVVPDSAAQYVKDQWSIIVGDS